MDDQNSIDRETGSHPVIKFEKVPVVSGRLFDLSDIRPDLLRDVVDRTSLDFDPESLESHLGEAMFQERMRLRKTKFGLTYLTTLSRRWGDQRLWRQVRSGLLKSPTEVNRQALLQGVLSHYADEIGGNFDPRVYKFATLAVPWMFNWLLNVASLKRIVPWRMTQSLQSQLKIVGEVPLLQKLHKQGTILLVPTHQSNIDSVLIGYVIYLMSLPPFAYGAGLNLFMNPVLSFFMGNLGAYTVDRAKTNLIYKQVLKNYSTRMLEENIHSIFFPGGGRSKNGAIESKLKLGLLGTGLEAQFFNLQQNKSNSNVYVVPMVMSYDFVLEASSLIEDSLSMSGGHRFMGASVEDPPKLIKFLNFFWKLFSGKSGITVRIGRPLDVFGNLVDDEGRSIGPNGTSIDPKKWLSSGGELKLDSMRDREYTRQLGQTLVGRYYKENTVLASHLVAFCLFMALRERYPQTDLYRFVRVSYEKRRLPLKDFLIVAQKIHAQVRELHESGELFLEEDLLKEGLKDWVRKGVRTLGMFHGAEVARIQGDTISTQNMTLLYYYRNRLSGYGLSMRSRLGKVKLLRGDQDEFGFLA